MNAPYHPPYLRERRSIWVQSFEFICLWVIFGSILFLAFFGAATTGPGMFP